LFEKKKLSLKRKSKHSMLGWKSRKSYEKKGEESRGRSVSSECGRIASHLPQRGQKRIEGGSPGDKEEARNLRKMKRREGK